MPIKYRIVGKKFGRKQIKTNQVMIYPATPIRERIADEIAMSDLYGEQHRKFQNEFDTTNLATAIDQVIVSPEIQNEHKPFIESRDFFFLSTVDHRGFPTCSYKGGTPGFLKVVDRKTLIFPSYDGNGMFLSMGNIKANNKIGMLFIDFETPHRVRVHGTASVDKDDALLSEFDGAEMIVRVEISEIFVNCPRYIHKYQRVETSKYAPQGDFQEPVMPGWKCVDLLQDVLPERDKGRADKNGGIISVEEYAARVMRGEG